jgi:hypothetical protein
MKKILPALLILSGMLLFSCDKGKKEAPASVPEFPYLITKDVQWKFHFVGEKGHDPNDISFVDTTYHTYCTVEPIGDDTILNGNRAHWYKIVREHYHNQTLLNVDSFKRQIEEDTVKKRLSVVNYGSERFTTVDYSDNTGMAYFDWKRGWLNEFEDGALEIDGVATTVSSVNIPGAGKRFFKARGIGGPYGPFSDFNAGKITRWGACVVTMDFIYKGQVFHFDF